MQGNATPFFAVLGAGARALGHDVRKVHFNFGDEAFWRGPGGMPFRDAPDAFAAWLGALLECWPAAMLVVFGRYRPRHAAAEVIAAARGLPVWAIDEGYVRPGFITCERCGTDERAEMAAAAPGPDTPVPPGRFRERAGYDVAYHLARLAGHRRYPHDIWHAPADPFLEYLTYVGTGIWAPAEDARAARVLAESRRGDGALFLMPLQMDGDYQLRVVSGVGGNRAALETVIASFARHEEAGMLVVKVHPLDPGLTDWRRVVGDLARAHGAGSRVRVVRTGRLDDLLALARGVVTVNSTVGMTALGRGLPVFALGRALYARPGLTHPGSLDGFWRAPVAPHPTTYADFAAWVRGTRVVPGDFFSAAGRALAAGGVLRRLGLTG